LPPLYSPADTLPLFCSGGCFASFVVLSAVESLVL